MNTAIEIARAHWGEEMPQWIADLARECEASSQNKVALRLGRSAALISQVLRAKYPGDLEAVEELFNGAFNDATVECPALGVLPANECRHWREKSRRFVNVNSLRVRMYRACSSCPRKRKEGL